MDIELTPDAGASGSGGMEDEARIAPRLGDEDKALLRQTLTGKAKAHEADVLAWYEALPTLLASGEEGRFALMHDGGVVSIWDTYADAMQAGQEKFGSEEQFWAGQVRQRELDHLQRLLAQQKAKRCPE